MTSARKIGDRIAMLHEGRIVWHGPAAEIENSGNPYVDQFVQRPRRRADPDAGARGMIAAPGIARPIHRAVEPMAQAQARYRLPAMRRGRTAEMGAGGARQCGAWNSLVEEAPRAAPPKSLGAEAGRGRSRGLDFVPLRGDSAGPPRRLTGIAELDRVCGGGLVPGSTILVGGDPGIGKSTLLLQAAAVARRAWRRGRLHHRRGGDRPGAAARRAARRRATRRCGSPRRAACATSSPRSTADAARSASVIDSIQTMYLDTLDSAPGTVSQVRGAAQELIGLAKRRGIAVVLVGHVTKEGLIAGPRVLEHMVDTVLYFEGERGHQFRILRAVKNRFGATDEIGVFEMGDRGLAEVPNPSALFLADRAARSGTTAERAASRRPARRCSPASRARGRCWSRCRRWSRRRRSARRAARWSAGTRTGWR